VTPRAEEPGPTQWEPVGSAGPLSPFDKLLTRLRQSASRLKEAISDLSTDGIRRLPRRAVEWFRDLSSIPKLVLVGLASLALLVLLSPVALVAAALLFGASIIALIVRVAQRGSIGGWGIVAVVSLVSMLMFAGFSDALYDTGFFRSGESASNDDGTKRPDSAPHGSSRGYSDGDGSSADCDPDDPTCLSPCNIQKFTPGIYTKNMERARDAALGRAQILREAMYNYPNWSDQDLALIRSTIQMSRDYSEGAHEATHCVPAEYEDHYQYMVAGIDEVSAAAVEMDVLISNGSSASSPSTAVAVETHLYKADVAFQQADLLAAQQ
jgi:hypothetical protein